MSKSSIQKNIKRNLPAYDNVPTDTAATISKYTGRFCGLILAIAMPIGLLLLSLHIVYTIPDVYSFDLGRTMVTEKMDYSDKDTLISDLMSDYMSGNTDAFILRANMKDGTIASVFTQSDRNAMTKYREISSQAFNAVCALIPVSIGCYIGMLLLRRKRAMKYSVRASLFIYFGSVIAAASIMLIKRNAISFESKIIGASHKHGDILPQLFGTGLRVEMFIIATAISFVAMILIYALTAHLTKGYKFFNRTEE